MGGPGGRAGAGAWVRQRVVLAAGGEAHGGGAGEEGGVAAGRGAAAGRRLGGVERLLWGEHAALAGGGAGGRCIVEDVAQRRPVALGVRGRGGDVAVPYRIVHHPAAATEAGGRKIEAKSHNSTRRGVWPKLKPPFILHRSSLSAQLSTTQHSPQHSPR